MSLLLLQWRYCIRIENVGELNTQLRERHWRIFSLSGTLETVRYHYYSKIRNSLEAFLIATFAT